ncbi:MAG TPA: hypothetical protein VMG58_10475 [Candidatus Sulfotelmatobacter sp.]|nr:hypothetical protein [Candidatus Sulfotelmatobacter sp.]
MSIPLNGLFSSQPPFQRPAILLAERQINQAGGINGKKLRIVMQVNQSTNPGVPLHPARIPQRNLDPTLAFFKPAACKQGCACGAQCG